MLLWPKIQKKLKEQIDNTRACTTLFSGAKTFQVQEKGKHLSLNWRREYMTTRSETWKEYFVGMNHVVCIREVGRNIEIYVHDIYHVQRYKLAYEGAITKFQKFSTWDIVNRHLVYRIWISCEACGSLYLDVHNFLILLFTCLYILM